MEINNKRSKLSGIGRVLTVVAVVGTLSFILITVVLAWKRERFRVENLEAELTDAMSAYYQVSDSELIAQSPEENCPDITIGKELERCLSGHYALTYTGWGIHQVRNLTLLESEPDCAIAMVETYLGYTHFSDVMFLLEKGEWKVAMRWQPRRGFWVFRNENSLSCADR